MRVPAIVMAVVVAAVAMAGSLAGGAGVQAQPQAAPSGQVTGVQNKFPNELVFTAEASAPGSKVESIRFHMKTGRGETEKVDNFQFTPAENVTGTFTLKTNLNNFIPAGALMTYWIDVTDSSGTTVTSEAQQYWYADTRFTWSKLEEGPITLYYYGGAQQTARTVMAAAQQVEADTGDLLGVKGQPFTLMLYNSARDIVGAQQEEQSATRAQELIRVGVAYSGEDLVQVLGQGSSIGVTDTARHEITHLFVHWAAGSGVPTWANEGLAVWSQSDPGTEYRRALETGIREDKLLLLRGMESFPGRSDDVVLAYGQSWSVIKYLIDTYGREKFREFYLKMGKVGVEDAMKQTFGLGYDEMDAKWRESVGAKPRSYASARPTAIPVFGSDPSGSTSTNPSTSGSGAGATGGGVPVGLLAGGAVALLLIVVGGALVARSRSKTA